MLEGHVKDFNPGQEFHEYVIEWTPSYVQWALDGNIIRTLHNNTKEYTEAVNFLQDGQEIAINFWRASGGWGWEKGYEGGWDMPWYAKYDYVKVEKFNPKTWGFDFYW